MVEDVSGTGGRILPQRAHRLVRLSNPPVRDARARCSPAFLEGCEPRVVRIAATKIEQRASGGSCVLDGLPQQQVHPPERMKGLVGGAVLVNHAAAVSKRKHRCDRAAVMKRDGNPQGFTE